MSGRESRPGRRQRLPLTVIVPTYNEAGNIRDCLGSVDFADEILVVDSFSTDDTPAVARELGARVVQREYGYSAQQKNWAIPQASHAWILLVDADERVTPGLRDEILRLLEGTPGADGYWIRRVNYFLGKPIRRCGWGSDTVIRLFRRDVSRYQDRKVHAEIDLLGPLPTLSQPLEHHTFRSFGQYWRKLQLYSEWGASQMYQEGKRARALDVLLRPIGRFVRMYLLRLGFLEGGHGLVLSMLGAFTVYLKYARLWEMRLLKEAPRMRPSVAAAGPLAREQIGRMVDGEDSRRDAPATATRAGASGTPTPPR